MVEALLDVASPQGAAGCPGPDPAGPSAAPARRRRVVVALAAQQKVRLAARLRWAGAVSRAVHRQASVTKIIVVVAVEETLAQAADGLGVAGFLHRLRWLLLTLWLEK